MKIGVVTTTIHVPEMLAHYARDAENNGVQLYTHSIAEVKFFVAGDLKTPPEAKDFCAKHKIIYLSPEEQTQWQSSGIIGWNTDSRRNFAILAALIWGAELIVTVDDDMFPESGFFWNLHQLFNNLWSGLQFGIPGCWFDHGQFTQPPARARGIPPEVQTARKAEIVTGISIGASQGIILGVPDTDAITAIAEEPFITGATDILREGFVAHPYSFAVFNSQFTAFRRELAPAAAQFYAEQGRNTDIFASLLMRYEMFQRGWHTYYGPPIGFHNRTKRPLLNDLKAEIWGMQHINRFVGELGPASSVYFDKPPLADVIKKSLVLSDKTKEMYDLWFEDCAEAMK